MADLLRDDQRRIRFAVDVTGPAARPKVEIDFAELEQRAKDAATGRARQELDRLLEDGQGDLRRILGDPADSTATGDELEDKAKSAVDGLLKGLGKRKG